MRRRTIHAALATLILLGRPAGPVMAQGRPSSVAMTCAQATSLVRSRGGLVLGTGGQTYDRYVSAADRCEPDQAIRPAFAPTRDNPSCQIGYTCYDPGGTRGGG